MRCLDIAAARPKNPAIRCARSTRNDDGRLAEAAILHTLIEHLAAWITAAISSLGYAGVVLLMAIESACIPLPSEIIMPFAGYLVSTGRFTLLGVSLAGAVGCGVGSALAYWAGRLGGRPLIERYGRFLLIRAHEIDVAERWFQRYGQVTAFVCRLLPVVRTFISFPAGMARMHFATFMLLSIAGSFPWCLLLAWIGKSLGDRWDTLGPYFHRVDGVILAMLIIGGAWLLLHTQRRRSASSG